MFNVDYLHIIRHWLDKYWQHSCDITVCLLHVLTTSCLEFTWITSIINYEASYNYASVDGHDLNTTIIKYNKSQT